MIKPSHRILIISTFLFAILSYQNCSNFKSLNVGGASQSALGSTGSISPSSSIVCDEGLSQGSYLSTQGPADLITVDASHVLRNLCDDFWGINDSPAWDSLWSSPTSAAAMLPLGFQVGRYWGGSGADWINWSAFPNMFAAGNFPTPLDAWNTIKNSGIKKLLIQTNPTTIGGNDPSGVPIQRAVNYFRANGIPVQALEIGNEQDNSAAQDAMSVSNYSAAFTNQCRAAKAIDPAISCMGPVSTNDWFWWPTQGGNSSPDTLEKFLALQGNKMGTGLVDKISLHWYPQYDLNQAQKEFIQFWPLVQSAIQQYDNRNLPVYFTEFSASTADARSPWMGTAIEAVDLIETFKLFGVGGIDYFTIHQVSNNWGFLQGSGEANPNSPTATYYGLYLAHKMGSAILNVTQGQERAIVSAYSSRDDLGNYQVMVINKSSVPQALRLSFNGYDPIGHAYRDYSLVGLSESQTSVVLNGSTMPVASALPGPANSFATSSIVSIQTEPFSIHVYEFDHN